MTEPLLLSQWAVCGIAAAAARFVPVPLLDDVIRQRARRVAVVRTLRAHGRVPSELLQPLWGEPDGAGAGRRGRLRTLGRRLLQFPVRKYVALFGAVRGVPTDVLGVVLLARTVDRRLVRGELSVPHRLPDEARALRRAVDEAIDAVDLQLLVAGLSEGLAHTRGLTAAAAAFARRRFGGSGDPAAPDALAVADPRAGLPSDDPVAQGAERVTEVLRRPEVDELLVRFDAHVDALLAAGR